MKNSRRFRRKIYEGDKLLKTLIFNGSPRKNGDTMSLVNEFVNHLEGEYKKIDAYDCNIHPCIDCRYCWNNEGCCQNDDMQEVYNYIDECDNILIASPLYFSELNGQLLAVMSRLQTYFCARFFRKVSPIIKEKKGGVILVGGGDGQIEKAYTTARHLLHMMESTIVAPVVYSHNTNNIPAGDDKRAIEGSRDLALFFNGNHCLTVGPDCCKIELERRWEYEKEKGKDFAGNHERSP